MPSAASDHDWSVENPWRLSPFPGPFPVPTMLTREEVDYLHWLASTWWTGAGAIVDLGCFLGGSTLPLAVGMRASVAAPRRARVLTYDRFVLYAGAERHLPERSPIDAPLPAVGESFRPLFDHYIGPHADRVDVRAVDLAAGAPRDDGRDLYPEQAPIEILFVDLAKSWATSRLVLRCFGRHLVPGRSVVVQQDFKWPGYWLHHHMHRLRACFEPLHDVPGSSMAFLCTGRIEPLLDTLDTEVAADAVDATWDEIDAWWRTRGGPHVRLSLRLARALHHADAGRTDACLAGLVAFRDEIRRAAPGPHVHAALAESWEIVARLAGERTADPGAAARLRALSVEGLPPPALSDPDLHFRRLWAHVAARLVDEGRRRVALYGAGRHTRRLLASGWPHGALDVVAVLDDDPSAADVRGVPVVAPADRPRDLDAVVLSSDRHEPRLAAAATRALGGGDVPIVGVYHDTGRDDAGVSVSASAGR
jgi:hypothetical protein